MDQADFKELLIDEITLNEADKIQTKYRKYIQDEEKNINIIKSTADISILAGVDVSYYLKDNGEYGISCAVLWDLKDNKIITTSFAQGKVNFPYKAGFLGFRESKLISLAINNAPLKPELILCDGHGINHPKKFGEAVQIGLALNIPSFGIAKNPFFGFSNWKSIKRKKGHRLPIWTFNPKESVASNEIIGYSICLAKGKKPVFISVGYGITLDTATNIAMKTTLKNRQPEPLRLADTFSRAKIKELDR